MVTNDERREVARRLRESAGNGEVLRDVFLEEILAGDTGLWFAEDIEIDTLLYRLADLIEPPGRCPHYHSGRHYCSVHKGMALVDRDALLDIADEMERRAGLPDVTLSGQDFVFSKFLLCYAERIRAALGVGK